MAIMHEIHRPDCIGFIGLRQRLRLFAYQALFRLDAQVQLQLTIDAVHALVIPAKALDVAQAKKAQSKAPIALAVRQPDISQSAILLFSSDSLVW